MTTTSGVSRLPGARPTEYPPSHLSLLFDAFARNHDRVAFVRGGRSMTYGEARGYVFRLARALSACGLRRGDGVAVLAGNTPGTLLAPLAAQLIGCYYTGVLPMLPVADQARVLADVGAAALVFDPIQDTGQAAELSARVPVPRVLSLGPSDTGLDVLALAADQPADPLPPQGAGGDPAELVYTSGSTGRPKAVCFTFANVAALASYWVTQSRRDTARDTRPDFDEAAVYRAADCRILWPSPAVRLSMPTVLQMLLNGGTCHVLDRFDPAEVLRTLERESITVTAMAITQLYQLLDHPDLPGTDLSSLRLLVYHSAPASPARLEQATRMLGPVLFGSYGQTETKMLCVLSPEDHVSGRPELLRSVGRPRHGVEVEVRDAAGRVLAAGEVGEICVRSPLLMASYWRQPELTARTKVDGWIRTRDVGYVDADGYVYLLDRLRDMVIVDGSHCYTLEVEDVLTSHPAVLRAAAVGLPDERSGEAVHAAVVVRAGQQVTAAELSALVRERKGALHAPRTVAFLDEIPLTPAGKPDKNALRAELAARREAG